ncbi:hypothetical protein FJR47_06280 [Sulfurimonas xiamenensis]|uniref:ATP-grasp domain-containing protein n=2 Tax=Sulfurimonas xiamenensis TaxID=2590021 RepID=A0AAJ4A402_9BACT|nr:hypothetical protein FJR47_06280 [Sulfurimonas xiamenensis]
MMKKNILFINGVPDDQRAFVYEIDKNGVYKWQSIGSSNVSNFLKNDLFNRSSILLDTTEDQELPRIVVSAIFNEISDADTHKITLKKADDFYKSISDKVPFFNPPANVMNTTRDNIYRLLQEVDKLHVPKTVKIQPKSPSDIYDTIEKEHFEFPVIFRQAGDHGGISTVKIDDKTEQFYAFPLDGRDYYLTQFVDYADTMGIYTKYRLVVVDGEVYIRHVIFSDSWVIHSKSREYMEKNKKYQSQEAKILKSFDIEIKPKIKDVINQIYQKLKLDYFGIDCYIDKDMNILVFEINANMGILLQTKGYIFEDRIETIRQALIKMILEKNSPKDFSRNNVIA